MEHRLNFMKKPQIGFCKNLFSELRFLQKPLLGQVFTKTFSQFEGSDLQTST